MRCSTAVLSFVVAGCLVTSCSPYNRMRRDFDNTQSSVGYLHTSAPGVRKKDVRVFVAEPVLTDPKFAATAGVFKGQSSVTPAIIYYGWDYNWLCKVGPQHIKEKLPQFISSSFVTEAKRSGNFYASTSQDQANYRVEITVDSVSAGGPFQHKGYFLYLFFAYAISNEWKAGPGTAYSRIHYKVWKGDELVLEDDVSSESSTPQLKMRVTERKFHENYRANLVDQLSETFRHNIEQIVSDVNTLLDAAGS